MVYTKRYFVEISSFDKIDDARILSALKNCVAKSHVKLHISQEIDRS